MEETACGQAKNHVGMNFAKVVTGSGNPVKLNAVKAVLSRCGSSAQCFAVTVSSGIPDQPWGDEETQAGARARAVAALASTDADLAIGIEGGVVVMADGKLRTCAWAVAVDRMGRVGIGGSLAVVLPQLVAERVRAGEELGHAMDAVSSSTGTKFGRGAVGILSAGMLDRQQAYEPLVVYALAPWLASEYFEHDNL